MGEPKLGVGGVAEAGQENSGLEKRAAKPLPATKASLTGEGGAGNARTSVSPAAKGFIPASAPGNTAYRVGSQDVLDISVFQVAELAKSSQVSDNGTINLPLVGEIPAAGFTAQEIERDLTKRLKAKYLQNPQVTVFVKEFNSQRVTVEGAVKKQGVFPLRGKTSLLQSIAMAEGVDSTSDNTVVVFRMSDKGRTAARFDLSEIRGGKSEDPLLAAGDVVVVGQSIWKETFGNFVKILPLVGVFALL